MSAVALRMVALAALVVEILVHVRLAPDHLHEVPYVGAGFVVSSALLFCVAGLLVIRPAAQLAWLGGAAVSLGMAAAFVASRTVGLPDLHEAWTSDGGLGLVALAGEAVFVACATRALRRVAAL
jgi:hypothetical protein